MAGKRRIFKTYDLARTFVMTLGLTGMQDWIAYAKDKAHANPRPKDIPSNPWTIYREELAAQGKKFSINDFIGMKAKRKARTPKADGAPKVAKAPKAAKAQKVAKVEVVEPTLTPFEMAKQAIQAEKLKNRDAFYDLKRKNMLPVGVPRNPDTTFKNDWKGWGDFLGNVATTSVATGAEASF